MKKSFLGIFFAFLLTACVGSSSSGIFGSGVSIALDPRTLGTQIDDSIMQKNLQARLTLTEKKENSKNLDYLDESDKKKIKKLIKSFSLKDIASLISEEKNISKKLIYNYCLKIKDET